MDTLEISADDFARRFSSRTANLMWFLGAGASAAAGIPTASDMVWDFKRRLYISQRRGMDKAVDDLATPSVTTLLQSHVDSLGNLPPADAPDEYAALFEAVFPSEIDRRTYIDSKVSGAKPSYGHIALAGFLQADLARLVWTTNFDPLVEDACAQVYGSTGPLTLVTLNSAEMAAQQIAVGRWPIEIKIHGDFRSRRLKNTDDELRHQDLQLRRCLVDACRRWGLIVVGYSGRDSSVMEVLEQALEEPNAFPMGLFWLHRGSSPPYPRVIDLIRKAVDSSTEAAIIRIENFDETMRDLVRVTPGIDTTQLDAFSGGRQVWSAAPSPSGSVGWPVIRLNALELEALPSICRRVSCKIGGERELQDAIRRSGVDILACRTQHGVLAFGSDAAVRAALGDYDISEFDLHTIDRKRLRFDSSERGLIRRALTRAIARHYGMSVVPKRGKDLLYPLNRFDLKWEGLKKSVGSLSGAVPGASAVKWHEGVAITLDWANETPWLLVDPTPVAEGVDHESAPAVAEFVRERTVRRYNLALNDLIVFWTSLLSSDREMRALAIGDGVDATFRIGNVNAFTRRAGA